jgi:hypothetical protein
MVLLMENGWKHIILFWFTYKMLDNGGMKYILRLHNIDSHIFILGNLRIDSYLLPIFTNQVLLYIFKLIFLDININ